MRRRLALLAGALVLAAPALAAVPQVDGRAYLVANGQNGEVLLARNANERLPMASITKVMTVLVALEHATPDDVVTVSRTAAAVGESSIYLSAGERLSVRELVEAALIQSANDAAVALAEHVGGSQERFVAMMNAKARKLRLRDTRFANADGLDSTGHYSSARDLTRLARIAMRNRLIRETVRRKEARISPNRHLTTWDDLLSTFPGLIGVKTGHTSAAGWSQVGAAVGRGVTIYATILGSSSRESRNSSLAGLLSYGLSRYRTLPLIAAGRVYAVADTPFDRPEVPLVAVEGFTRVVRIDRPLVERVLAVTAVGLPVRKGQPFGEVQVWSGNKLLVTRALVAARDVAAPGMIARAEWYLGRAVDTVWSWIS